MEKLMKDIQDYLTKNEISYSSSWAPKTNEGEISFWEGDIQYTFAYKDGKWEDRNACVLYTVKKMMSLL